MSSNLTTSSADSRSGRMAVSIRCYRESCHVFLAASSSTTDHGLSQPQRTGLTSSIKMPNRAHGLSTDSANSFSHKNKNGNPNASIQEANSMKPTQKGWNGSVGSVRNGKPFSSIQAQKGGTKIMNDPVHGHIELHDLCVQIIDTPQFQRLRYLKQLGVCYLVYMGATVNRFEHSIGTYHLAGLLVDELLQRQPQLGITSEDKLCVQIAGLCHDLGHGPFSHLFDGKFMKSVRAERQWTHEEGSIKMLDYLIDNNDLQDEFNKYGLGDRDMIFIKELIYGALGDSEQASSQAWPYKGRDQDKAFLYQIVSNKTTGIDVDKMDYFARDCHHLGLNNNFDYKRFMKFIHVGQPLQSGAAARDSIPHICVRDKEAPNVYELFAVRSRLHRSAYQHPVITAIELMITDALIKANDHIFVTGSKGERYRMSEAVDDMVAFSKLRDSMYHTILDSDDVRLADAKQILSRIERRQLYKCVAQTAPMPSCTLPSNLETISSELAHLAATGSGSVTDVVPVNVNDIGVQLVNINYGMKDKNPIDNVLFYSKKNPDVGYQLSKEEISSMLPSHFNENSIRIVCKSLDMSVQWRLVQAFNKWCSNKGYTKPKCFVDIEEDNLQ